MNSREVKATALLTGLFLFSAVLTNAQVKSKSQAAGAALVGRGKYIVEHVALCVECHTPRNENGILQPREYLKGAPVPVKSPPYPQMKWALQAPAIVVCPAIPKNKVFAC